MGEYVILGEYPSLLPEVALNVTVPPAAAEDASAAELSSNSCIWFVSRTMVSSFTCLEKEVRILIKGTHVKGLRIRFTKGEMDEKSRSSL